MASDQDKVALNSCITLHTPETLEVVNPIAVEAGQDQPSVLFHASTWRTEAGTEPGIAVEVFGLRAPVISAEVARVLAQWFNAAADRLEQEAQ